MARRGPGKHSAKHAAPESVPAVIRSRSRLSAQRVVPEDGRRAFRESHKRETHSPILSAATFLIASLIAVPMALPAYAASPEEQAVTTYSGRVQTLAGDVNYAAAVISRDGVSASTSTVAATNFTRGTQYDTSAHTSTTPISVAALGLSEGSVSGGLIAAAMAQLGRHQDCTALVENSMRAIGYNIGLGSVGPLGFRAWGTPISASDLQPGDLMMRSTHVAIWLGNNTVIEGGWMGWTTVIASDSPSNYSAFVRLTGN